MEKDKEKYPKYIPIIKKQEEDKLLLLLPTKHVKALKLSIIILFILVLIFSFIVISMTIKYLYNLYKSLK
jgi:hypothetical protein